MFFPPRYMALGVALRYVMEALQKPHGSKMYYFGIVALDRFRSRLKEYPRYCQHLMAIQHFNEFQPHLIEVGHGISVVSQFGSTDTFFNGSLVCLMKTSL